MRPPAYDPADVQVGIVHLGIGAFHRAHQAVYTDDVLGSGMDGWGICGVTQTRPNVVDQLRPQDGLFTVLTKRVGASELRLVGAVREVLHAQADALLVRERLAEERVRVVTVTVTEKGYRADPATGSLDLDDPVIRSDLATSQPFRSVVGQLVSGFAERRRADAGPVTVLSCDNLPGNSRLLASLVDGFCARASLPDAPAVRAWVHEHVAFADTVVDRVVPATVPEDLVEVEDRLGLADHGAVTAEPFRQWVIEDHFAAGRPAWERVGAVLATDVAPFQEAKLRLLNGGHSLLAYLLCADRDVTVSDAVADPGIAALLRSYLTEAATTLEDRPAELAGYEDAILERFADPSIRHRLTQIAADGSQKVPRRLVSVAASRVAAGREPTWSALGIAAWIRYVRLAADRGESIVDPLHDLLLRAAGSGSPSQVTSRLLSAAGVDAELTADPVFRRAVVGWLDALDRHGIETAIEATREGA
ncbi:mannitol dehydrogenase family protein [Nitriliruptor alkaliphilus]|uniref:mannitol dehydrogenase family protein n=1 Tax=Nitriliruptor alkaliphilus TaxID=427918 RepID=UPI00146FDF60|nr:mannitol dehydrogenase family protein [Nitriliruptor alkaliphilus]